MFFLMWGFFVWLGATVIFRLAGQIFFSLDNPLLFIAAYVLAAPFIVAVTIPLYRLKKLNNFQQLKAAIFITLPGMFIDALVLIYFGDIFLNLSPKMDGFFGSWLLWAYFLILLTGFIPRLKKERLFKSP